MKKYDLLSTELMLVTLLMYAFVLSDGEESESDDYKDRPDRRRKPMPDEQEKK